MSKVLKYIILSAYGSLFILYLQTTLFRKDEIEFEYIVRPKESIRKIIHDLKKKRYQNISKQYFIYEKPVRLPTDLKYILQWTQEYSSFSSKTGQTPFLENKCAHFNCFISYKKHLLVDPMNFDAILFDAENNWESTPYLRSSHQKYIFKAPISASNHPYCDPFYDNYYNLTWTYKLDSDIRWSHVSIEDKKGNFIGPKIDMKWIEPIKPTPEDIVVRLGDKRKAAAWFVSHCKTTSGREKVGKELAKELAKYNLKVDIYGLCGDLTCPRDRINECLELLEQDYYFYFSFEDSLCEDYVTEVLMYPLLHVTVPVVFGGANYSRFLPPGSYINAVELNVTEVAFLMNRAIKDPLEYRKYFRWHNHYVYKETPRIADVCKLCEVLNKPNSEHALKDFRRWWNHNYEETCKAELKRHDDEKANRNIGLEH